MAERIVGRNCTVAMTVDGGTSTVLGHWTKYTIDASIVTVEARSATTLVNQKVEKYRDCKVTVEGYRGGDDTFIDDVIEGSVVTITGANFPSLAAYGTAKVVSKKVDQNEDSGTWSLGIEFGFLDIP